MWEGCSPRPRGVIPERKILVDGSDESDKIWRTMLWSQPHEHCTANSRMRSFAKILVGLRTVVGPRSEDVPGVGLFPDRRERNFMDDGGRQGVFVA